MTRAILVYNPKAGRYPSAQTAGYVASQLRTHGWEIHTQPTRDADHVAMLAREAAADELDVFLIAGGDGSIGIAAAGLVGSGTAMAVLPTGTTNVWAQELGLPRIRPGKPETLDRIAALIAGSTNRLMDVGMCNGRTFLLWAGIGLDALVVRRSEQRRSRLKKKLVIPEYMLRTLKIVTTWPGVRARIRAESLNAPPLELEGTYQISVASNIGLYAGGLATLSPEARLDDGEMDMWLFEGKGTRAAFRSAWNIVRGSHVQSAIARRISFSRMVIEIEKPAHLHNDGEPLGPENRIELTVNRQALNILVPTTMNAQRFSPQP